MADDELWTRLHGILMERMETEREVLGGNEGADLEDIIDAECAECGRDYYSDYLMPNPKNRDDLGEPIEELCIPCYQNLS